MNPDTAEPTEVVEAFLDAFEATDSDTALSFVAADAEYTSVPIGTATRIHDRGA